MIKMNYLMKLVIKQKNNKQNQLLILDFHKKKIYIYYWQYSQKKEDKNISISLDIILYFNKMLNYNKRIFLLINYLLILKCV